MLLSSPFSYHATHVGAHMAHHARTATPSVTTPFWALFLVHGLCLVRPAEYATCLLAGYSYQPDAYSPQGTMGQLVVSAWDAPSRRHAATACTASTSCMGFSDPGLLLAVLRPSGQWSELPRKQGACSMDVFLMPFGGQTCMHCTGWIKEQLHA